MFVGMLFSFGMSVVGINHDFLEGPKDELFKVTGVAFLIMQIMIILCCKEVSFAQKVFKGWWMLILFISKVLRNNHFVKVEKSIFLFTFLSENISYIDIFFIWITWILAIISNRKEFGGFVGIRLFNLNYIIYL